MNRSKHTYRSLHRITLIVAGALILLAVMIASVEPQPSKALPGDLSSAMSKYPNLATSSLNTCDLCHTASIPSLNPYGQAYKNNGRNTSAFGAIENLDSDGDGFTNIQEINALTFPGNPASLPAAPTATNTPVPTAIVPTATSIGPTATSVVPPNTASATVGVAPVSVLIGGSSAGTVSLNNIPTGGFASAEFTCSFNPAVVSIGSIAVTNLFGTDPVTAIRDPQNGSFIVAIAGSRGNKALTGGPAFTFQAQGLAAGQSSIDCQARVSTGNQSLASIPSTPATLSVTGTTQGTFAGKVTAGKPVTLTLYDSNNAAVGTIPLNPDGTFSYLSAPGSYTAVASATGFLRAQGALTISSGSTVTFSAINLLAGDIDGNDVIDQFDALTIGINYNGTAPAAADLNGDNIINVLDLEIMAANYREVGPLAWQ